jgi:hypothetical protein
MGDFLPQASLFGRARAPGDNRQRSFAPPSVLPDISPSRGEIVGFDPAALSSTPVIGESQHEGAISPLEGEMSGRTEGGGTERSAQRRRNRWMHPA